jgi:RND family efflux transporter MFP subunit
MRTKTRTLVITLAFVSTLACRRDAPEAAPEADDGWAVTAWGERYEVFAETDPLVAGRAATSNAHATVLGDFSPLKAGAVSAVLKGADGREQRFRQTTPKRDGIFPVEIKPAGEGTFALAFVVEGPAGAEEIAAGTVKVGSAAAPGGLVEQPKEEAPGDISFLKEQQWRTEFGTAWVEEGTLRESVSGPAKVLPARGGEAVLTASVDAVVEAEPWPYRGQDVASGAAIFRLRPRAGDRSLPELTADAASLAAETDAARNRVGRLNDLVEAEAASQAELERAKATLAGLEARLTAARRSVSAVSGGPRSSGTSLEVRAPWAGRVADVAVSPGQSVAAATVLGRLVKPRPLWLELALRPEDAARLKQKPAGLNLRRPSAPEPLQIDARGVRLVAIAPEIDAKTATLASTLEIDRSASELPIGSTLEAEVVLGGERRGIVIPESALVDDAGVAVVYVQDSGEAFTRHEVRVLARQGTRALVSGLKPRQRLVTRGGAAVRRSALLSSGAPEGHVH